MKKESNHPNQKEFPLVGKPFNTINSLKRIRKVQVFLRIFGKDGGVVSVICMQIWLSTHSIEASSIKRSVSR